MNSNELRFSPINIDRDYREKWNIGNLNDFIIITRAYKPIRNTLYRVGGIGTSEPNKDGYFMLLKHIEAFYPKDIMKGSKTKNPRHLEDRWCILDKDGNEKIELKQFKSPYLIKDSCIYSVDQIYYNIETGEEYCQSYHSMQTDRLLFLNNEYDKDESRRGVLQINKKTGNYKLFPVKDYPIILKQ